MSAIAAGSVYVSVPSGMRQSAPRDWSAPATWRIVVAMTHLSQRHRGFAGVLSLLCLSFGCGDSSPSQRDDDGAAQDASSQGSPDGGSPGRGDDAGMATDGGTDGGEDHETLEPLRTEIGAPMGAPVTATIGAAGGTLVSPDGVLSLEIPAGALAADTAVGIQPIAHLAPGGVGAGYELTPEGTTFAKPVTLRFKYTEQTTAGSAPTLSRRRSAERRPLLGAAVGNRQARQGSLLAVRGDDALQPLGRGAARPPRAGFRHPGDQTNGGVLREPVRRLAGEGAREAKSGS